MTSTNQTHRIAVIGKGNVGQAIGEGWKRRGHQVVYAVKTPAGPDEKTIANACVAAEIVVLATPWGAVADALANAGDLAGKIVIDCTNPLAMTDGRLSLAIGFSTSGGEQTAALAKGARVFKTLNQTSAENMADASKFSPRAMMYVAGDDAGGKAVVMALVDDLGFEAIDAGPLVIARLLEPLAMLWIDQALTRGAGRDFAFARLRP